MSFEVPDHVYRRMELAQRRVESDLADIAQSSQHGSAPLLSQAQSRVLQMIPPRGITATELAGHARVTKQGLGQMVDVLEERGLVVRIPDARDGRSRIIRRTPQGDRAFAAINDWMETLHGRLRASLGDEAYEGFWNALEVLGRDEIDPYRTPTGDQANTDGDTDNT